MGLFFNYDKAGPGVDKNAPKKKGIFLYAELFFRKFWLLIKANMLYFALSLPVMAIYNIIIITALTSVLTENLAEEAWQLSLIFTAIITVLWGAGPISGGYTYLLRNFAREEHVWLFSDFFEKSKETFKLGMVVLLCDLAALVLGINAFGIYTSLMRQGFAYSKYAMVACCISFAIYTFMHYYIYELSVTFENKLGKTFKNALVMGVATLPANLFLTIFVILITFFAFERLASFLIIVLLFLIWISFMRFPIDFYTARMIKRNFIDNKDIGESEKENDGIS